MKATIITIGDEILIGQIINTNSAYIGKQLNSIGIGIHQVLSVGDDEADILDALNRSGNESEVVLITGGLGPTSDDITKPAICKFFNSELIANEHVLNHVTQLLSRLGVKMSDKNRQQAMVPVCAKVLHNRCGTAPGLWIEQGERIYVFMPGVPFEMKTILDEEVLPLLNSRFVLPSIRHKTILTQGIAESHLSDKLGQFEAELPKNIKLAYLPSPGFVKLRLTGFAEQGTGIDNLMDEQVDKLRNILGSAIYGYDEERLEEIAGRLLLKSGKQLATAESCTGGAIAAAITSVPGSSMYYKGSIIAYANEVKIKSLGVAPGLIAEHGAVSREVVSAMAVGVLEALGADYAIATSGIAGPDGGTPEKPVGTTWIAVTDGKRTKAVCFHFGDDRGRTVMRACQTGLNLLRLLLETEA